MVWQRPALILPGEYGPIAERQSPIDARILDLQSEEEAKKLAAEEYARAREIAMSDALSSEATDLKTAQYRRDQLRELAKRSPGDPLLAGLQQAEDEAAAYEEAAKGAMPKVAAVASGEALPTPDVSAAPAITPESVFRQGTQLNDSLLSALRAVPIPKVPRASGTGSVTIDGKTFEIGAGGNWDHAGIRQAMSGLDVDPRDSELRSANAAKFGKGGFMAASTPESEQELAMQQALAEQIAAYSEAQNLIDHPDGAQYGKLPVWKAQQMLQERALAQLKQKNEVGQMFEGADSLSVLDVMLKGKAVALAKELAEAQRIGDKAKVAAIQARAEEIKALAANATLKEEILKGLAHYRPPQTFGAGE